MNPEEFKTKVLPLQEKLYGFSLRILGNSEDARDAVQDIYVKLWKMKDSLHTYINLDAFVMTVTRNHCLDKLKGKKTVSLEGKHISSDHYTDPSPEEILEKKDVMEKIKLIISGLPENQRTIIHLRDIEGYDYNEISNIIDMSVNNIRVNLSRARKKIREELLNKYYKHENSGNRETIGKVL